MKLKNYLIIFCLFMVLLGCIGATSAATDHTMNEKVTGMESEDDSISVINDDNPVLGVDSESALSAQSINDDELSIQTLEADNSSNTILSESGEDEFYVSTEGNDDNNTGTQDSPFATIAKAISFADASKDTIIHIGEGTFTGQGNTNLAINMDHLNNGGNLTLMGVGNKTIINGENQNRFITSINQNSFVILKNIYINNTRATNGAGGAIYCQKGGILIVDNCTFENTYSSSQGGAIYCQNTNNLIYNNLTVTNSIFKNDHSGSSGGAIYTNWINSVEALNNTFINCTGGNNAQGAAIKSYTKTISRINGNKFYNITTAGSSYDAGLYATCGGNSEVINNTFMNCHNSGTQYAVAYIGADYVSGNKFINSSSTSRGLIYATKSFNCIINVSDIETTGPNFTLSAHFTDADGNSISSNSISYFIDGANVGSSQVVNGTSTLDVYKFYENDQYEISCRFASGNVMPTINTGILTVNMDRNPVDLWVDAENGEDVETAGTESNPFKSIAYAISQSSLFDTTIHLKEGTYKGEGNTNLAINIDHINSGGSLTIMGVGDKTIIDGENQNRFISSINPNSFVILENIYINNTQATNGAGGAIYCQNGNILIVDNCTFENTYASQQGGAIYMTGSYLTVTDSVFKNDHSNSHGGAICANNNVKNVEIINNTFINCTGGNNAQGAAVYSREGTNSRINGNKFYNITTTGSSYDAGLYSSGNINYGETFEITDNTFVNCHNLGTQYAVVNVATNYFAGNKFINCSSASKGLIYTGAFFNFVINVSDVEATSPSFTLSANVTDVDGNSISLNSYNTLMWYVDGQLVGFDTPSVSNGTSTLDVSKFYDNGEHTITCEIGNLGGKVKPVINNGILTMNMSVTPVNLWVDAENGEDVETAGNETNPFKTISYAISQSPKSISPIAYVPTIHLKEGTYKGEQNTKITIDIPSKLIIAGAGKDKTIIDGENANYFFNIATGNVLFSNLTFINGFPTQSNPYCINVEMFTFASLELDNIKFENNTQGYSDCQEILVDYYGSLKVTNCEFNHNGNERQTAVIYAPQGNIKISNSTFTENIGSRSIIRISNGNLNVTSSSFIDNNACCICGDEGTNNEFYVVDCNFTNNDALNSNGPKGGAIYGKGYVSNCIFTNNSASSDGGAIYFVSGEILNCEFYNNTAATLSSGSGGAIYAYGEADKQSSIENCYFEGNKALAGEGSTASGGGAIYTYQATSVISCTFINNSAVQRGGAIRNGGTYLYNLTIIDSIFINNTAGANGGAISAYIHPSTAAAGGYNNIYSSQFINNTAGVEGGAIENYRTQLNIDDCSFEGNTALSGGAIITGSDKANIITIITNSNFTNNHAESNGGAIESTFNNFYKFEISKSIFIDNNAMFGGAIYDIANVKLSYSALVNNTAYRGSAIFLSDASEADLENNWWGRNDNPNQFIQGLYEIKSWAVVNALPEITGINPGDNITVYFTDESGYELEDSIPVRQIIVGDDSYDLADNTATITAEKSGTMTLSVDNEAFEYNVKIPTHIDVENDTLTLKVNDQVATGASLTPAYAGNLTYTSSNESVVTVKNGKIIALSEGTATITVSFAGDDTYAPAENKTISVAVTKIGTTLTGDDVVVAYKDPNAELTATITDASGNPLSVDLKVDLNGESYNVTSDSDGKISIPIGVLAPKTYAATISYAGDDTYASSSTTVNVVVTKADTIISAEDVSLSYKDPNGELIATIVSEHGKTLVVNLNVELNGKTYTARTNSSGQASIPIGLLSPGTYTATISYKGSSNYQASNTTAQVVVTKATTIITADDISLAYRDPNGELVATVVNEHGKTLIVDLKVTLNGKTYTARTNSSGQASISLYNVTPGTYTATISYKGSGNYKASTTTAQVTVTKAATIITAPDVTATYKDPNGKLVSTIVNEHGKPLVVTMKVELDGKTYSAKTDSNGQMSVSTANLAPGTYTAKISYKGSSNYESSSTTANVVIE